MKNVTLVSALALAVLSAGAQAAGPKEALTLPSSIWFDGYCDGITNITKISRSTYAGTYDASTNCGLFSAQAGGAVGRNLPGTSLLGQGAVFTIESYPVYGITYSFAVNGDGTWAVTDTFGTLINSGTWTSGALAGQRGTRSSLQR